MAIDVSKIQKKLNALQKKGSSDFWKPEEGVKHQIRIVPTPDGDPFKEFWFHYDVGPTSFLCPKKNYNESCAACDFSSKLYKEKTDESTKMAKKFLARQRFFSPIVVRGQDSEGIKIWGYGKTAYEALLGLVLNPDYGDISEPETGTDLTIESKKASGANFPTTAITPSRKSSSLCKNAEECKALLDTLPDLEKINERKTSAEVSKILDEHLNAVPAEATEKEVEEVSKETSKYGAEKTAGKTKKSAVDAAFAKLMETEA